LQAEVSASRVKLRRAGRGGASAAGAGGGGGGDDAAAAAAASCGSLGSNVARELEFSSLTLGEQISGGGFCLLYKGKWLGVDVAVKRMFDPQMSAQMRAEFANECAMLANLCHPHIVQLLGACSVPPNLVLVTDFCGRGSLFHVLHEDLSTDLSRARKASLALQLAHALAFVHAQGVVHRDIKAHNVLADSMYRVKLCGQSLSLRGCTSASQLARNRCCRETVNCPSSRV
jgi:serine/threonine protein kinase